MRFGAGWTRNSESKSSFSFPSHTLEIRRLTTLEEAFIDQAKIRVKAGDVGNGCVAYRREKFVPRGGPSGGDGGVGGDVILESSEHHHTLIHFHYHHEYQ